jgi:hypothetical protein
MPNPFHKTMSHSLRIDNFAFEINNLIQLLHLKCIFFSEKLPTFIETILLPIDKSFQFDLWSSLAPSKVEFNL